MPYSKHALHLASYANHVPRARAASGSIAVPKRQPTAPPATLQKVLVPTRESIDDIDMILPGFRASCLGLAATYILLAGSILARGPMVAMADYRVPAATLASPHYADAMTWVFLHMTMLGAILGVVGWYADDIRFQRPFVRLWLVAQGIYLFLDVRAADWPLGTALYKGRGSLGPAVVGAVAVVLWLRLNVVRAVPRPEPGPRASVPEPS